MLLIGKKIEMKSLFDEKGNYIPITVLFVGPQIITQIKTVEKDGYDSAQIGATIGDSKKKSKKKSFIEHLKKAGDEARVVRSLTEMRAQNISDFSLGQKFDASFLKKGDMVTISSTSKGKGFQGVVKRHGFKGQGPSHGHKDQARKPGSIGTTAPQRVMKGRKMAGRMGGERVTVKDLKVVDVIPEKNTVLVKGSVPGARNTIVEIRKI